MSQSNEKYTISKEQCMLRELRYSWGELIGLCNMSQSNEKYTKSKEQCILHNMLHKLGYS